MSESIINNDKKCIVCGTTLDLHRHHIFYGTANRKKSEKYGCWCYLCAKHHNMSNEGVHFDKNLDISLKRYCEKKFLDKYPDLDFKKVFGKDYL